jgi:hypothetical protein
MSEIPQTPRMIESSRISGTVMCVIRELFGVYLKVAPRAGGEVLEMPIVVLNALGGMNRAFSRRRLQISSSVGRKEREEVYLEGKVLVSTSSLYVPTGSLPRVPN